MTEKLIWKGKGPIMYAVYISGSKDSSRENRPGLGDLSEGWNYMMGIRGSGKYSDANLSATGDSFLDFFADTKEGIIRDLAWYVASGNSDVYYEGSDLPPKKLNLDNVEIFDETEDDAFHDMDAPYIFANAKSLSKTPMPSGEHPFVACIDEENPKEYRIAVSALTPFIYDEFDNSAYASYSSGVHYDQVAAKDVNRKIKEGLSHFSIDDDGRVLLPDINNTKILNLTDNAEFALDKIFPLRASLHLPMTKLRVSKVHPHVRATLPLRKKVLKAPAEAYETLEKDEEEKKRLRA